MITEHFPVLVIVIALVAAYTTLLAGWIDRRYCFPLALGTIAIQFSISLYLLWEVVTTGTIHYNLGNWLPPWGIEYVIDRLNAYVLVILLLLSLLCCIYS